ncbi:DDHD domain-containing protein [Moelleriella libera RCEF 2490]|uniref:DDHD domain-containing protein n=1 Tax=Moelleriella libera RCEF 2490 TaxID=1081109 RepID=A0A168AT73_9HYPO|nr:DDHD domain-containing protein [Moelleriella libera RCEF 2490]
MPPAPIDKKAEKSYLSSAVDSINPWSTSRTTTPTPDNKVEAARAPSEQPGTPNKSTASPDHSITPLYGQSFRTYPRDCPPLIVQWFHAVDVPKRKPKLLKGRRRGENEAKPLTRPKKFAVFSESDSKRVEARYQKLLETAEEDQQVPTASSLNRPSKRSKSTKSSSIGNPKGHTRVAVNEDYLFDIDIEERELAPVYWLGPIYEVRNRSKSQTKEASGTSQAGQKPLEAKRHTPTDDSSKAANATSQIQLQLPTYRLFGAYMNNVATYEDDKTAWMTTDGMLSWVAASVYERFAGGGYMSGVKVIRGYSEPKKPKEKEDDKVPVETLDIPGLDERQQRLLKRRSAPPSTRDSTDDRDSAEATKRASEERGATLQRQLSSLIGSQAKSTEETEEQMRKRDEQEIQEDYNAQDGEAQGRPIEHLVLVTHGIGQRLGLRMESINFVHDVNVLRKTIKSVYSNSADLKALNSELGTGPGNCRVQVLPVCWRHLIEFPRQRQKTGEHDLGDASGQEDEYPSLEDITVEGVAFARSLISDLALDVLLYQSSYRDEISRIVVMESNRIFKLYRERNPDFKGKVHLMGHSLGSAILFDVLCQQRNEQPSDETRHPLRILPISHSRPEIRPKGEELEFDFATHDFFCLGSPVGLFQMLKGRTIASRLLAQSLPSNIPLSPDDVGSPFSALPPGSGLEGLSSVSGMSLSVSSPKVEQLFNIFHPSDPISYRMEPLISTAMASLKPQALPYTKRGIFGNVTPQGLTGIGAKVGQSVSDLWSSLSAGIASNLLNRSLGITNEEVARLTSEEQQVSLADKGTSLGVEALSNQKVAEQAEARKRRLAANAARGHRVHDNGNSVTLIDDELETLFSTFQKRHDSVDVTDEVMQLNDESRKARKLRIEEAKVRALNRNGRVDYNIQE